MQIILLDTIFFLYKIEIKDSMEKKQYKQLKLSDPKMGYIFTKAILIALIISCIAILCL